MSRIGKKPIEVPAGVKVSLADHLVTIEGKQGTLTQKYKSPVVVEYDDGSKTLNVSVPESAADTRVAKALWGTTRALLGNMITGVTQGYTKKLEINGVGWNGSVQGATLKLQVGFANTVIVPIPQGLTVTAEKTIINVSGADKQAVGQFAAVVRKARPPEPYNGKGIKYANEVIRRKQGKKFGN